MCELVAQSTDWLMVDRWQTIQKKNPGAQASKNRFYDFMTVVMNDKYKWEEPLELYSVCGIDLLPKLSKALSKGKAICIINRVADFDLQEYIHALKNPENLIILEDKESKELSSTFIRNLVKQGKDISRKTKQLFSS